MVAVFPIALIVVLVVLPFIVEVSPGVPLVRMLIEVRVLGHGGVIFVVLVLSRPLVVEILLGIVALVVVIFVSFLSSARQSCVISNAVSRQLPCALFACDGAP